MDLKQQREVLKKFEDFLKEIKKLESCTTPNKDLLALLGSFTSRFSKEELKADGFYPGVKEFIFNVSTHCKWFKGQQVKRNRVRFHEDLLLVPHLYELLADPIVEEKVELQPEPIQAEEIVVPVMEGTVELQPKSKSPVRFPWAETILFPAVLASNIVPPIGLAITGVYSLWMTLVLYKTVTAKESV
jgi:hypothetical protein